ncbi:MAG TPA: cytidylate kinase-like family protein [Polyangia bacterium]|jgi:cytidylate kinase
MARDILRVIDTQINRWRAEQRQRESEPTEAPASLPDAVCISNSFGAQGAVVAALVGERLQLPVYDREIVAHIAQTAHVHVETVETLDQRALSRIDDFVTALFRERAFDLNDYVRTLTRTVAALWGHGPCVLVGHGAVHIVPRDHRVAVRVVGAVPDRVRRVMALKGLDEKEARRLVQRTDAEREGFHRRGFGAWVDDPVAYDLIVNTSSLPISVCATVIVDAYRAKFAAGSP